MPRLSGRESRHVLGALLFMLAVLAAVPIQSPMAAAGDATGAPTISGTAEVRQKLTASTSGIGDPDGLTSPTFAYRWIRVDSDGSSNPTDIAGATSETYVPVVADLGKKLKVKVSFRDDANNAEELTSDAYPSSGTVVQDATAPVVVRAEVNGVTLTIHFNEELDQDEVPSGDGFIVLRWFDQDDSSLLDTGVFSAAGFYCIAGNSVGGCNRDLANVDVSGNRVILTLPEVVRAQPAHTIALQYSASHAVNLIQDVAANDAASRINPRINTVNLTPPPGAATGAPTISGTAEVRQKLTASTSGIGDPDGLTSPTFAYRWIRVDSDGSSNPTDIAGATSETYVPVAADLGKKLKVKVSFRDDADNAEELTSDAYPSSGTVVQDATAPVVVRAEVNGVTLTIHFNEELDQDEVPSGDGFIVLRWFDQDDSSLLDTGVFSAAGFYCIAGNSVGGCNRDLANVDVSGNRVILTLPEVVRAQPAHTIALQYSASHAVNLIQDVAANDAASRINPRINTVNLTVDNTAPTLTGAGTTSTTEILLSFDEALDSGSIPDKSQFTVKVEGNSRTVSSRQLVDSNEGIRLDVSGPVIRPGETVTVSYTKPTGTGAMPLKDAANNETASFTDFAVDNNLAATAPEAPPTLVLSVVTIPGTANEYGDRSALVWITPWHNGSDITKYQYRYAEGTSVPATTGWTDIPDSAPGEQHEFNYTVEGLDPGTQYTFEVRAVNGIGGGDEKAAMGATPTPNWSFTLRDAANTNVTQLTEGGDAATATVSITNNVRFGTDQTVQIKWAGTNLEDHVIIEGAGDVGTITIESGQSSGTLAISAPDRTPIAYTPDATGGLTAELGGTQIGNSVSVTIKDDENSPVITITDAPDTVNEGDNIQVEITATPPFGLSQSGERTIKFGVTDGDSALSGTLPTSDLLAPNQGSKTITLTAAENTTQNDGAHDVTFALELNDDSPYTLGTAPAVTSVTITVRDDDTPPLAPANLRAQAGNTEATLRWEAPPASDPDHGQPVLHYESRVKVGTAAFGSWTTIPGSDGSTRSHKFTGLTNGTEYTYEVRAENVAGDGAEAEVMVTPRVGVAVSFGAATLSVDEGGTGQATVMLATAPAAGTTVTVPITATPGEGLGTGEYSGVPASVTFSASETSKSFTVSGVQDTLDEPDEVLTLSLGTLPAGYVPGTPAELEITVVDDDVALLGLTLRDSGGNDVTQLVEGGSSATAEVSITNNVRFSTDQTVTLEWGGAEISSGLIQGAGGSATFTIGAEQASGSLTISAPDRPGDLYRLPETGTLTASIGGTKIGNGIELGFVDDEAKPVATMVLSPTSQLTESLSRMTIVEGGLAYVKGTLSRGYEQRDHSVSLPVEMTGSLNRFADASSSFRTIDGKQIHDLLFVASTAAQLASSLQAADGSTAGDHSEHVFTIQSGDHHTIGSPSSATLIILDNDAAPTAPRNLRAQARDGSVVLTWDPPTSLATTEFTAYELRHVVGSSPGGTFADISTDPETGSHTVTGLTNETEYTFELRAKNSFGSSGPVSVSKTPREGVAVSFGAAAASVDEGGSVSVTLTLGEAPTSSVTVPIAATPGAGLDSSEYSGVPPSVTFNAGQTSRSFTVATVDDADDEPDRTLTLILGALPDGYVPGANEALILTVADNDVPIVSATFGAAAASVAEGVPYDVTVSLSQAPEREVALPISAARGANLAANEVDGVPSSVTFAADETSRSFTVTFADDAEEEGNETLTLTFGTLPFRVNSAGANPQLVLTVTDDDGPPAAPDVAVQTGDGYAELSWAAVANDSPILRYEVRWKEEGGAFTAWVSAGAATSYRAEGLTNGKAHEFEVRAVNAHGNGEAASAPGTPSARITRIPNAPQHLRVNATDSGRAELKWGKPANATDEVITHPHSTMSEIQGYRIEVCRTACDDETNWYALVPNTGKFEHRYTHQVLAPGVIRENRYRVQAININGKVGPWSNVATLDPTVLENVYLQTPDDSTLWVRFKVRNPDGNALHVRYENTGPVDVRDGNTGTGTVGYAERRLTKKGDVTLVLSGLDAGSWYRVDLDFVNTFDSERMQSHRYGTAKQGHTPLTSPYAKDMLDAQVWRGGQWREAPDNELYLRMGGTGKYRVRLKPCGSIYNVRSVRIQAPAGRLRASPTDTDPSLFTNLNCEVEQDGWRTDENGNYLTMGQIYDMTNFQDRANDRIPIYAGTPNNWHEVTVTARALEDYPADTRVDALLSVPFAVVYNHEVSYGSDDTRSGPVSEGTGLVRILVDRPADATLPVPAGVTIGSATRVMSWEAVPGATNYLVEWRYGPHYSNRANRDRSHRTATSVTLPLGGSGRGPITARVRAYSASAVSAWSAELTWDSRPPTLSVLDTAVNEDDGAVGFLVTLDPAATGTVTVDYATQDDGTAVAGTDYTATSGTLTFAPGEREKKTDLVPIADDDEEDSGETFRLVLSNPTGSDANNGAAALGDAAAVATILNSEQAAAALTGFTLVDAGTNGDLMALADGATVRLGELLASSYGIRANLGAGAAPGSVRLELSGAKTAANTDDAAPYSLYGDGGGRINGASLPAGSYTLTATAYADSGGRGDELGSLTVSFAAAPGALATTTPGPFAVAEGATAVATLAATETGTGATATWSIPDGTAGGADGEAFALTAKGALSLATAKDFEAPDDADGDGIYAVTVAMAAGEQTATVDLRVTLTNVNEAPLAKATATPQKVREGVEVTLDGRASADPDAGDTLSYAWTQTEDGPRVTLSDAAAAQPTFTSPSDLEAETELTFTLRATDAGGLHAEDTATVTVTLVSAVSIAAAADYPAEGADAVFRLTRAGSAFHALTVPVTVSETGAMLGADAPESATFAAGSRTAELRVPTVADEAVESDSEVTATLSSGAGWVLAAGATTASVTVLDDDAAPVQSTSAADVTVWSADMTVVEYGSGSIGAGTADLFSNQQGRAGLRAKWLWYDPSARKLKLGFDDSLDDAESLTLHVGDLSVGFPDHTGGNSSFSLENVDIAWTDGETLAARVSKPSAEALSTDATLASLTVSDAELVPDFDAEVLVYRAAVDAKTATVAATTADAGAALAFGPAADADAGLDDYQVAVPDTSEALVEVTVTAADGTVRRYRAVLSRAAAEEASNAAPTGLPAISGTAEVGGTLAASADGVEDGDGLDNATFAWQWLANDGAQDAAIDGATGTSYEVTPADVGRTLKARVTFTDDDGNEETLDSAATAAVVDLRPTVASLAMAAPPVGGWTDGDTVRLAFAFSAPVTVATDGGTPSVGMALDGTARQAAYAGGSGRSSLTFSYALTADDGTVSALSVAADALAANGGTIRDADGRDANLAHAGFDTAAEAKEEPATPAPLTASFSDVPATHDGAPFAFTLTFSEAPDVSYVVLRDDAFAVSGGDVGTAQRKAPPSNLEWTITVEPDDTGDAVTVELSAPSDCDAAGAICTADGTPLTGVPAAFTVAGPTPVETEEPPAPLTASFGNVPAEHDGSEFTFDLLFSEAPRVGYRVLREDAFAVTGGTVERAQRQTPGSDQRWTITVKPLGHGDVSIGLPATTNCDAEGAVCTSDERPLSNANSATVRARAALSVADAAATEAAGTSIDFVVSLSRAATGTVTVDYATADGSATAGADYTAASGTLTFSSSQTSKTVSVTVLDDTHDDDGETFTLRLSNAAGARIADSEATGTIVNTDPLPKGWLARFGRTSAVQVVGLLDARFDEARAPSSQLTLGGRSVTMPAPGGHRQDSTDPAGGPVGPGADPVSAPAPDLLHANPSMPAAAPSGWNASSSSPTRSSGLTGAAGGLPNETTGSGAAPAGPSGSRPPGTGSGAATPLERLAWGLLTRSDWSIDRRQFLSRSSFNLSLSDMGGETDGEALETARVLETPGHWSMWGRGALTHFGGIDDGVSLDGDVLTGLLGVDYSRDRWLAGLALAYHDGDGSYRASADAGAGTLDSTLVSVHPYLRYALTDRLSAWGALGYGRGTLTLRPERGTGDGLKSVPGGDVPGEFGGSDPIETAMQMRMGALGLRGTLFASATTELALKSDVLWVSTASDATDGLQAVDGADASRLRLLLSGRHRHALATGGELTPSFELGLRYDDGDAETGAGVELGGGLHYTDPALGLTVETRARALLAHEDGGYEEWGLSGSLQLDPGRIGRGLSLRLDSGWGATASGAEALWQRQDTAGLAQGPGLATPRGRITAEMGYGLDVPFSYGILTPYSSVELAGGGSRTLRLGWRFELGQRLSLSLAGERRETAHARPEHGLMLRTTLPW